MAKIWGIVMSSKNEIKVQVTRKVAPKRNRTTIKKIVKQEMQRAGAHYNLVRLFAYNFIGSRKAPEYKIIIGINKDGVWAGDKIEIIVKGTNAHRLSWLFSNQYKKNSLAKSVGKKEYTKIKQAREKGKR